MLLLARSCRPKLRSRSGERSVAEQRRRKIPQSDPDAKLKTATAIITLRVVIPRDGYIGADFTCRFFRDSLVRCAPAGGPQYDRKHAHRALGIGPAYRMDLEKSAGPRRTRPISKPPKRTRPALVGSGASFSLHRTRNCSTICSSSSIPKPGPWGARTRPSTRGGRLRTSFRSSGEGLRQYSTRSPCSQAAIQCKEAARLMPVEKQCGTHLRPAASARADACTATVRPPQIATSG